MNPPLKFTCFRSIVACLFCSILSIASASQAKAGESAYLVQASDWSASPPKAGPFSQGGYEVLVWAPAADLWSFERDGSTLSFVRQTDSSNGLPRWRTVGELTLGSDESLTLKRKTDAEAANSKNSQNEIDRSVPPVLWIRQKGVQHPDVLDVIRGPIDTLEQAPDARRETVRTNKEGANFEAPASAELWRYRAAALRDQLRVTLGLWPQPPREPLDPKVYGLEDRGDYTIEKFVLKTLPGFYLSGNVYKPKQSEGRLPAILCPHGHWEDGRVNPEVQQRCIRLAKLGFFVVMYDMVGYNDSKYFKHEFLNPHLNRWGYSLPTLQTWNSIRVVDWLTERPDVDPARIGCTGESGGGTQTFLLAALDPRISVSAPVVMVSEWFQGGCVCENTAGLRHGTDNVEIAALAAPRPMKLVGATGDWTAHTTTHTLPVLREVYRLLGFADHIEAETFSFPHNYNQTSRNAIYPFLTREFLGFDDPERTREGDQTTEKPETLWTFNDQNPAPAERKTAEQLEADLTTWLGAEIQKMRPQPGASTAAFWPVDRETLLKTLKTRLGLRTVSEADSHSVEIRRVDRDGVRFVHSVIERDPDGARVPVVLAIPQRPSGRLTVFASGRGKAGLIHADGSLRPLIKALLDSGQMVVGFDPLLVGESANAGDPRANRPTTAHFETYNKSLAADHAQDLATVLGWARQLPTVHQVNLAAVERAGPIALLSLPLLEGIAHSFIDLAGFDYGDGTGDVPASLDLPGVLQFGGLPAAAALAAPNLLWISRPGTKDLQQWAESAYRLDGSLNSLRIDDAIVFPEQVVRWLDKTEWPR